MVNAPYKEQLERTSQVSSEELDLLLRSGIR